VNDTLQAAHKEPAIDSLSATEAEFETALREIEARVDRRLLEAAELRHATEQELAMERYRAGELEKDVERLRLEIKRTAQTAAAAEAKLNAFEQMLEAVEDDIDERIEVVTAKLQVNKAQFESLVAENAALHGENSRLCAELSYVRSTWIWRARSGVRKLFGSR
jgi:ABC-type phosphate transport system auxiliary subunit